MEKAFYLDKEELGLICESLAFLIDEFEGTSFKRKVNDAKALLADLQSELEIYDSNK